jgi:glycosyltransferase involved in cell wall biosynthesis
VKPMTIAHLVDSLELGGMETTVLALAKYQIEQGNKVFIGCLLREGDLAESARTLGIEVKCFFKSRGPSISTVKQIAAWVTSKHIRVVHTHNEVPMIYAATALKKRDRVVVLNTRHDMGVHQSRGITDFAYKWLSKKLVANVAVCEAANAQFQARRLFSQHRAVVVPNGIDVTRLQQVTVSADSSLRQMLKLNESNVLIGSIGRLTPVKAVERQIKAFLAITPSFPLVHLIIVGDGPDRSKLEEIVPTQIDRIHFLGKRNDVPELLSQLDVFMQSSITEGHSIALLEAASAGVPVLATDVGGNKEIVQNGITGLLVESFDEKKYVTALTTLLSNQNLRKQLGTQAKQWAFENASVKKMADSYQRIYNRGLR